MKLFEFFSVPSVDEHNDKKKGDNPDSDSERQRLANDLYWYILDHDSIHKEHFIPIAQKIEKEFKKDKKVDKSKYQECWMPMVKQACLEYHKNNKMHGNPKKVFDEDLCKHLCKRLADRFIEDIKKGEYKLG